MTAKKLEDETAIDSTLAEVFRAVKNGEVKRLVGERFNAYKLKATELSIHRGCLTWGARVVIPASMRPDALRLFHAGHRRIVGIKAYARSYVGLLGIDKEIELCVTQSEKCQLHQKAPPKATSPTWDRPTAPWDTTYWDFAGPVDGQLYPVVIDAYFKWLEVRAVRNMTSSTVIFELRSIFAAFGIPRKVMSDNGTTFISREIKYFYFSNSITAITSAPYHPAMNGQAKIMVQQLKKALSKGEKDGVKCRLARFV